MQDHSINWKKGVDFEIKACQFLYAQGIKVLKHRYKTPYGEIDIIGQDKEFLVAIEVKIRKFIEQSYNAISYKQKKRIENALLYYCCAHNLSMPFMRFDAMLYSKDQFVHIKNAWYC